MAKFIFAALVVNCIGFMQNVRYGSHQGESLQDGLRDMQTCGMTLASAYMLCCLSAICYRLKLKVLSNRTTLVLSNTRELDRVPNTK